MNNHPLDQLDTHVPDKDSTNTAQPIRKGGIFHGFFSVSKSKAKVKAKSPTQSLKSEVHSQQSIQSSVASQITGDQNKPLPMAPTMGEILPDIFPKNVAKPAIKTALPGPERIERTDQLLYCNMLLLQDSVATSSSMTDEENATDDSINTSQEPTLNKAEQEWLKKIEKDPVKQDHIQWLVTRMVEAFIKDSNKDSIKIAEIVALAPVLRKEPYRKLLSTIITEFDESRILDINLLHGLVHLIQSASPKFLVSDDLIKILSMLRTRLQGTHQQSSEHSYHVALAVSRVLDVMADHKVQDLDRVLEHEPLSVVLSGLKNSSDPYLMYQACYAFQALQYVPDDETALQSVLRHSAGVVDSLVKVTSVLNLDLGSVLEGLEKLHGVVTSAIATAVTVYEGVGSLVESGQGVFESLKEGLGSGQRKSWYPAIRAAHAFVQAGQVKDLKQLIFDAPCRCDALFQWGICQLLGEIAVDSVWSIAARQQAIDLVGHLYRNDQDWGRDESFKTWMMSIVDNLGSTSDQAVSKHAIALLQELNLDNTPKTQHPYPLRSRLPIPDSFPILTKAQKIPYMEYELYKLQLQRLKEEQQQTVYISPMAKPSLRATDDELFPLMENVQDFLASDRQVMLILGDSGAGKSTFNRRLERQLWTGYKRGGPIPLFINLSDIDEPKHGMVRKQLQFHNFNEDQIQELKLHRQLVLICDGYDESQQQINLHKANFLNQPGQWNTKMVITCRTQYLGPVYRDRFQPQPFDRYNTNVRQDLFQEAVIAPFSNKQIKGYVDQYVQNNSAQPLSGQSDVWPSEEYMDKLMAIPNLMDLVRNPFLLTLALDVLPTLVGSQQDVSSLRVTRVSLYDEFVEQWLNTNKLRLHSNTLRKDERDVLEELMDDGFIARAIDFQKRLADSIFKRQDGHPVVQYIHLRDVKTWKAEFFSMEPQIRLLRECCPFERAGNQFRFVHRSVLEYFLSCVVYRPGSQEDEFGPQCDSSPSPIQTFDIDGPLFTLDLLKEPSVIQFLCDRVQQHPDFKHRLRTVIEQSKTNTSAATAAANAISILVKAGVSFNGVDFRGIRTRGADLTGGQFDSAQLQDADLTGVNLSKAWIRQADFSGACMDRTQLGELPYLEESEKVYSCAFSPDGKFLAAGLDNGNISIYDTATWTRIHVFQGHKNRVTSLAYSSTGLQLISGSWDKTARLWNCKTGSTDFTLEGHTDGAEAVAFSPTCQQVASAGFKSVRLWDTRTGAAVFIITDDIDAVTSIIYSPDGNTIACTSRQGTIQLFDTLTGLPVLVSYDDDCLMCLTYSSDGRRIATGSYEGRLQLWEATATTLEPGRTWEAHTKDIASVAFSPDNRWIASSSKDRTVKLWDSRSGSLISSFVSHTDIVNCIRFSPPDGSYIASASDDKTLRLWKVSSLGSGFDSHDTPDPQFCVAYSPDGRHLISGGLTGPTRQLNADSGDIEFVFPAHLRNTRCIAFSPDGLQLAIGGAKEEVTLWSVESCATAYVLSGHEYGVYSVAFSPCGRWLASGDFDSAVRLWHTRSGTAGRVLYGHEGNIQSVTFSPDGHWITSACSEGKIRLWETSTGVLKADKLIESGQHKENVVAYRPGCPQVTSCHGDGAIRLWDDDQQLQDFRYILKQDQHIYKFAFSSYGQWVATAHNTCVRLWRLPSPDQDQQALPLQDQDCVSVIEGFTGAVRDVVWRPNKLEFATASHEGSIRAWRVEESSESGRVSVHLLWASGPAVLAVSGALLQDAAGLSPINRKLLEQRGATVSSAV
ncbi:hypothetical protein BG015_000800 [Linnemannia schmuckeri]|uniref:WD40 repeat-like protein n=1 Tax=Linnemannia schmuckeri TaxID=64567 RepID=A0A9P5RR37_9FUNG|nr:hypothetical protein BG015_000800 [Linnemannia schmuckeri]